MRTLFIVILSLFGTFFMTSAVAVPIYGDHGRSQDLPEQNAGEVDRLFNGEHQLDADILMRTAQNGAKRAIEALRSGNYSLARQWAVATREFLSENKLPIPKLLIQVEKNAAEGLIGELLVEADIAIHQALLPKASVLLEKAAEISADHGGVMHDDIMRMIPKTKMGRGTLLLKYWNDKRPARGYFDFKV